MHKCASTICNTEIADHLLMCSKDWRQVPADIKRKVNSTWKAMNNAEISKTREAMRAYRNAREEAINAVSPQGRLV